MLDGERPSDKRGGLPVWCLPLVGCWLGACAPAPVTPEPFVRVPSVEIEYGRQAYQAALAKFPAYEHPALQRYVQAIGARLAAGAPRANVAFHFTAVDNPGLFAYSFAHGEVIISRGMLAHLNSEAQLAGVLAHEIGHVVSSHQERLMEEYRKARALESKLAERFATREARDMLGTFSLARVRGYRREHEVEADVWSERLLARAGYNPGAAAQVLRFLVEQDAFWDKLGFEMWDLPEGADGGGGVFATHPSSAARLELSDRRLGSAARAPAAPDPAYLERLRGVVYGLSERDGVQRGTRYLDPSRRVMLAIPEGWYMFAADGQIIAAPHTNDAMMTIEIKPTAKAALRQALEGLARGRKLESVQPQASATINGVTAIARSSSGDPSRQAHVAVLDVGDKRVSVIGVGFVRERWGDIETRFKALIASVHLASETDVRGMPPARVQLQPAPAAGMPPAQAFPDHARERWGLLNQVYGRGAPAAGTLIKTVR